MKRRDWMLSMAALGVPATSFGRQQEVKAQDGFAVPGGPDDDFNPMGPFAPRVAPFAHVAGGRRMIAAVALSADGTRLAAAGLGEKGFRVWDAADGLERLDSHEPVGGTFALAFAPNGQQIASAGCWSRVPGDDKDPNVIRLQDPATGEGFRDLLGLRGYPKGLAWSRAGVVVALDTAETLRAWNVADGALRFTLKGPEGRWHGGGFRPGQSGFGVSADGRRAASLSTDGEVEGVVRPERTVNLWDGDAGTCRVLDAKVGPLRSVAMSPDGARVIVASTNKVLVVIDFATSRILESFGPGPDPVFGGIGPYFLAFSPDGAYFVFGKKDGVLQMYGNGAKLSYIDRVRGPRAFLRAVAFLPDRLRVVSGGIAEVGFYRDRNGAETWRYEPLWIWDVPYRRNPHGLDFQRLTP